MERDNILSAPEVDGTHIFYEMWHETHYGSLDDFYRFMTTPTIEREKFLDSLRDELRLKSTGSVVETILSI